MKDNKAVQEELRPDFLSRISDSGDINKLKEKIDLKGFKINESELKALAEAIKKQNKVTSLNLAFSGISAEKVNHLITAIENNHNLTELDLSGNNITDDVVQAITFAPALTSLNLIRVTFDDDAMELLANNLTNNKTLTSFQLGGAFAVDDEAAAAFAKAIEENDTLTSFSLGGGYITDKGAPMIAAALKKNHTLKSIILGGKITNEGVNNFATALENNHTLTGLSLSCANSTAVTNLLERNKKIQLEKFKAVVFIGSGLEHEEAAVRATYGSRSDVKIIIGNMGDIDFAAIDARTDKDTMFIIGSHGINESTLNQDGTTAFSHFIEDQPTDKFLNKLKDEVGHDISVILFACHGGGALKFGEINPGITLMTKASSKYTTLVYQGTETMLKILELKTGQQNLSNQAIYQKLPGNDMETYYYRGGNEGDKTIKFPKIIKFSLEEIKSLLKEQDSGFTPDQQNKIYESLSEDFNKKNIKRNFSNPEIFSIAAVKRKIDDPTLGLNKTLCNNFVKALEAAAEEKLSPDNVKNFLKNRVTGGFKTENVVSEIAPIDMLEILFMACNRGDFGFAELILNNNPDLVNQSNKSGDTVIAVTIGGMGGEDEDNVAKIIEILINSGLKIDEKDNRGYTPLMTAVICESAKAIELLIKNGALPEIRDANNNTALMMAVKNGKDKSINALAKNGANVDATDNEGCTSLMNAAKEGKVKMVELLLKNNAKVDAKDGFGVTALEWTEIGIATGENKKEIIRLLKEAKKNQSKIVTAKAAAAKTVPAKIITTTPQKNTENKNKVDVKSKENLKPKEHLKSKDDSKSKGGMPNPKAAALIKAKQTKILPPRPGLHPKKATAQTLHPPKDDNKRHA